jgi:glutamate-1-semialdehyde 2,1-aminomutase
MCAGIPKAVSDLTVKFNFNDIASVERLFRQFPSQIACLVMEPEKTEPPRDNFLEKVQRLCKAHGTLLVFDEIITGFRYHLRGAQHLFGVQPDLSTFGKALGNGFGISALVGRRDVMELGGFPDGRERVFLLSTTFGAQTYSLAAALETMRIYEEENVVDALYRQGAKLAEGVTQIVRDLGIQECFGLAGRPCNLVYWTKDRDGLPSQWFRTLFLQETLRRESWRRHWWSAIPTATTTFKPRSTPSRPRSKYTEWRSKMASTDSWWVARLNRRSGNSVSRRTGAL